jgi:hypothetical protein
LNRPSLDLGCHINGLTPLNPAEPVTPDLAGRRTQVGVPQGDAERVSSAIWPQHRCLCDLSLGVVPKPVGRRVRCPSCRSITGE